MINRGPLLKVFHNKLGQIHNFAITICHLKLSLQISLSSLGLMDRKSHFVAHLLNIGHSCHWRACVIRVYLSFECTCHESALECTCDYCVIVNFTVHKSSFDASSTSPHMWLIDSDSLMCYIVRMLRLIALII